jgi:hypothetical protein
MVTLVIPKKYDQKCPDFGELLWHGGTPASSQIPVFSQFRSKSKIGIFLLSAVSEISSVLGPLQNGLPMRKFLRDFLYKITPRESVCNRRRTLEISKTADNKNITILDFDRN